VPSKAEGNAEERVGVSRDRVAAVPVAGSEVEVADAVADAADEVDAVEPAVGTTGSSQPARHSTRTQPTGAACRHDSLKVSSVQESV
jgi:hypothetical protein